jgi:hypothetical protein
MKSSKTQTEPRSDSFVALLLEEARRSGQELVLDIPAAVEWVFGLANPDAPHIREGCDSATLARAAREYHRAEAEILEHTAGQPFRLDTPDGPLFLAKALDRYAGTRDIPYGQSAAWDGQLEGVA